MQGLQKNNKIRKSEERIEERKEEHFDRGEKFNREEGQNTTKDNDHD